MQCRVMLTPADLHKISSTTAYPAAAGLRLCLRSVTAEAHARLDARLGAFDLTSLPGYRPFLEANAAALLPLEAALEAARVAEILPDWELRSRKAAILEDLARVGGGVAPLPTPGPFDLGGILGTMYVLEGSRLDARMLLNAVKRSADAEVLHATAFLRHGAGHHFWPSFLAVLESHAAADHEAGAIDGAMQAFAMFERAAARTHPGGGAPARHPLAEL
jgi:heme oxygenase (biliverdin-IX-beta and delta-forming)